MHALWDFERTHTAEIQGQHANELKDLFARTKILLLDHLYTNADEKDRKKYELNCKAKTKDE